MLSFGRGDWSVLTPCTMFRFSFKDDKTQEGKKEYYPVCYWRCLGMMFRDVRQQFGGGALPHGDDNAAVDTLGLILAYLREVFPGPAHFDSQRYQSQVI